MSSLITTQAAVESVNCLLKVKPNLEKNSMDFGRLFTGRLTKIFLANVFLLNFAVRQVSATTDYKDASVAARKLGLVL